MTDLTAGAVAPPKKRSFFKKAAWQTAPKAEQGKEHDMFSHSNEFRDIVAEQTQRINEEKRKAEEARKRKVEEERERKRRKVSMEIEEEKPLRSTSGSSTRESRMGSKGRSKTPLSPIDSKPTDTLFTRYDSLTKSSSSSSFPRKESDIIDLGSDDDYIPSHKASPTPSKQSMPMHSVKRAPSEELEEMEDPALAALKVKARARAAERAAKQDQASPSAPDGEKAKTAVVQLFITSTIPNTSPLFVKVRTDTTIAKPKEAWCAKHGFTPEQTQNIFMTFKKRTAFDTTTIQRLGLHIHDNGCVTVDGDPTIYDETNLAKVHLDAWTNEAFQEWKREEAEEAAAKKKAAEPPLVIEEPEPEPEPEPKVKSIRLFLKARGKEPFRIAVKPETEFGHLAHVYKQNMDIPKDQPITLMFDGDRLRPMDTVADTDIEDLESIEVYFK